MLKLIVRFFTLLSPLLQRLGICATAGFIAGAFAGFMLWLYAFFHTAPASLSASEIIYISLILALMAWLILLFVLVALARLSFLSIWYSSLFNALLTCFFTVLVVYKLNLWIIAEFVGMLIGIWIGLLLCYINNYLSKKYDVHK